mmetsp:Transcript_7543/g.10641  ORF Transcript_7543/g.10641 Transcript_7543/m.10641 type:complete len:652 (-) Transcript_7543:5662-7617(-)
MLVLGIQNKFKTLHSINFGIYTNMVYVPDRRQKNLTSILNKITKHYIRYILKQNIKKDTTNRHLYCLSQCLIRTNANFDILLYEYGNLLMANNNFVGIPMIHKPPHQLKSCFIVKSKQISEKLKMVLNIRTISRLQSIKKTTYKLDNLSYFLLQHFLLSGLLIIKYPRGVGLLLKLGIMICLYLRSNRKCRIFAIFTSLILISYQINYFSWISQKLLHCSNFLPINFVVYDKTNTIKRKTYEFTLKIKNYLFNKILSLNHQVSLDTKTVFSGSNNPKLDSIDQAKIFKTSILYARDLGNVFKNSNKFKDATIIKLRKLSKVIDIMISDTSFKIGWDFLRNFLFNHLSLIGFSNSDLFRFYSILNNNLSFSDTLIIFSSKSHELVEILSNLELSQHTLRYNQTHKILFFQDSYFTRQIQKHISNTIMVVYNSRIPIYAYGGSWKVVDSDFINKDTKILNFYCNKISTKTTQRYSAAIFNILKKKLNIFILNCVEDRLNYTNDFLTGIYTALSIYMILRMSGIGSRVINICTLENPDYMITNNIFGISGICKSFFKKPKILSCLCHMKGNDHKVNIIIDVNPFSYNKTLIGTLLFMSYTGRKTFYITRTRSRPVYQGINGPRSHSCFRIIKDIYNPLHKDKSILFFINIFGSF